MNYNSVIMNLYFLLVYTDGGVNQKEIAAAKEMIQSEGISVDEFNVQMQLLQSKDRNQLYAECLHGMRKLEHTQQIRVIAWLCVIANADGFMDRTEWQLIYTIYHKELDLPLSEIFALQKELNRLIWEKNLISPQ
jgi:uncharacterized tellurite resistance protein B-like protein